MWWGEIYLALTLVAAGLAFLSKSKPAQFIAIICVAQYLVANLLHDYLIWSGAVNLLSEIVLLFLSYYIYVTYKHWLPGYISFLLTFRVYVHAIFNLVSFDDYTYAVILGSLYFLEVAGLFVFSVSKIVGDRGDKAKEAN